MEWNGGLKNGMVQFFKVELATMCLRRGLILLQRLYEQVQCMLPAFYLVWYHDVTVRTRVP